MRMVRSSGFGGQVVSLPFCGTSWGGGWGEMKMKNNKQKENQRGEVVLLSSVY